MSANTTVTATEASSSAKKKPRSIFDTLAVDPKVVEDGRWFENVLGDRDEENLDEYPGIDLKLRRLTSKFATKARMRAEKDRRHGPNRAGALSTEDAEAILIEQLANGVIVDWRGVVARDGNAIQFTPEVAREVLTALPDFRFVVLALSNDLTNFKSERREELEGN